MDLNPEWSIPALFLDYFLCIAVFPAIDKRVNKANLPMKIKQLRSYYATQMRNVGLLSEQIDLIEGRIGKSIFLLHYFKENPKLLSDKILDLLPTLEHTLHTGDNLTIAKIFLLYSC